MTRHRTLARTIARPALLALALVACAPAEVPSQTAAATIRLEIEGNDGAAMGQQGSVLLTSDGRLRCSLATDPAIVGPRPPLVHEIVLGDLFEPMADVIRAAGVPGPAPDGPNVAELTTPAGTIHVPPGPRLNGFGTGVGADLLALLRPATGGACLPFG